MKQELKELKGLLNKLDEAKRDYSAKRDMFDFGVAFVPVKHEYLSLEEDIEFESSYEYANIFYEKYGFVATYAEELKKEHPRFGEKRFKNTLIENIINNQGWDYENDYEKASYIVDAHLVFDEFGYFEVKELENQMLDVVDKINANTDALTAQTFGAVKGAGKAFVNVLKPYGQVAKGQLEVAGQKAKTVVNNGAKRLIKVLENVANKTDDKK